MKKDGFTLLETLISITVCTYLVFSAFSSWWHFKQKNKEQYIINEIKMAIHYAKIQAINSNQSLQIKTHNWSKGMDLTSVHDNKMVLLHQWRWDNPDWDIYWQGVNGLESIVIMGTSSSAMSNGRFILTNKHDGKKIELVLNKLGRLRQI